MKNILVLAPHADDETFGLYTYLSRRVKDSIVHVHCFSVSHDDKTAEHRHETFANNMRMIGCSHTVCNHEALNFENYKNNITDSIFNIVENFKPDIVLIPNENDLHQDHKVINHCAKIVCRPSRTSVEEIMEYKVPGSEHFSSTYFDTVLHLTDDEYNEKEMACNNYSTEIIPEIPRTEEFKTIYRKML